MILVDDQSGSKDLFPYIKSMTAEVTLTRIDPPFGDMVWWGNGPDEKPLSVAVEYKKIRELLDSQINGRFVGHQLIGLVNNYDRRFLLVEGRIRTDRNTGVLQELRGDRWRDIERRGRGFTYRELEHWYTTIEEQTQTRVVKTYDEYESARWLAVKHSWYTNKGWDEHDALKQFHVPQPPTALITKPGIVRRVAKELEGVGWDKSIAVAEKFKTVREMINANEQTWREIKGIGKGIARSIILEVTGGQQ